MDVQPWFAGADPKARRKQYTGCKANAEVPLNSLGEVRFRGDSEISGSESIPQRSERECERLRY